MKEIFVLYKDGTYELLKLRDILSIKIGSNFIAIDESKTSVWYLKDVKEIKFL